MDTPITPHPTGSTSPTSHISANVNESSHDTSTEYGTAYLSQLQEPEELFVEHVKVIFDNSVDKLIETVGLQPQNNYNGEEVKSLVKVLKLTLVEELGKKKHNLIRVLKNYPAKVDLAHREEREATDCSPLNKQDEKNHLLSGGENEFQTNILEKDDCDLDQFALQYLEREVSNDGTTRPLNPSSNHVCSKISDKKIKEVDELFKDIPIPNISKELEKLKEQKQNELDKSNEEIEIQQDFQNCDILSSTRNLEGNTEERVNEENTKEVKSSNSLLSNDNLQNLDEILSISKTSPHDEVDEEEVGFDDLYDFVPENLENIDQIFESEIPDQNYDLELDDQCENGDSSSENEKNCNKKEVEKNDSGSIEEDGRSDKQFRTINSLVREARRLLTDSITSGSSDNDERRKTEEDRESKNNESNTAEATKNVENSSSVELYEEEKRVNGEKDESGDEKIKTVKKRKIHLLSDDDSEEVAIKDSKMTLSDGTKSQSDLELEKSTKKRRRVVVLHSSDEEEEEEEVDEEDSPNVSRKNIKKILSNNRLNPETRDAEKAERDRRKRIEERQHLYKELNEADLTDGSSLACVILEKRIITEETLVEVDKKFVKSLKLHQAKGIKFLYDCTIETLERLKQQELTGGCILAHSMGLGKTFQVVAFLHTIMNHEVIMNYIKRVLIIVPLNVIKNWVAEFNKWFEECDIENTLEIYDMTSAKNLPTRIDLLSLWHEQGGIMVITTNLFTKMVLGRNMNKKQQSKDLPFIEKYLVNPGADIVVIDEGHLLKNDKSALNKAVSRVETPRRIILTGTPLQNNLSEYFVMVDFVKPNLLGSKKEFKNRFENPITNGQHVDSTDYDVSVMKKRVHVLHNLLGGCINRCDYSVLVPYLKPKFEYVLSIALTKVQTDLYKHYIENISQRGRIQRSSLLSDHSKLSLICSHPVLLVNSYKNKELEKEEDEDSLKDFIVDDDGSRSDSSFGNAKKKGGMMSNGNDSDSEIECIFNNKGAFEKLTIRHEVDETSTLPDSKQQSDGSTNDWYKQYLPKYEDESTLWTPDLSGKFMLLLSIIEQCELLGDKILIFSQSLASLSLIERILRAKMHEVDEKYGRDLSYAELITKTGGISHRWLPNIDYYRIDGNVSCQLRSSIVNNFNDPNNYRARLMLVSTKAGGIGTNLIGANRCIILDVSWNPAIDLQAIYRIFRYGQSKPIYVYRFTSFGTMENKIYERQIVKQSLSHRVIDEQQIQRHFKGNDVSELYMFTLPDKLENRPLPIVPKDRLLADMLLKHKDLIVNYHEHDSLLQDRPDEQLTDLEREMAWVEYNREKNPPLPPPPTPQWPQKFFNNPYLNNFATPPPSYEQLQMIQQQFNRYNSATSDSYQQYYSNNPGMMNRQINCMPLQAHERQYHKDLLVERLNQLRNSGFIDSAMAKLKIPILEKILFSDLQKFYLESNPEIEKISKEEQDLMFLIFIVYLQNTARHQIPKVKQRQESQSTVKLLNCYENLKNIRETLAKKSGLGKTAADIDKIINGQLAMRKPQTNSVPDVITLSDDED